MTLEFSRNIFEKYSNTKFHENPYSGSRVVPCGQTERQKGVTKLIVSFRNFAKEPKKQTAISGSLVLRKRIRKRYTFGRAQ